MATEAPCAQFSEPIVQFVGTGRGGDRTTRLLLFAAVLLLASGVTAGGVTAWSWWGRVRAVQAAQERLAGEWPGGAGSAAGDAGSPEDATGNAAEAAGRRPPMPFAARPRESGGAGIAPEVRSGDRPGDGP